MLCAQAIRVRWEIKRLSARYDELVKSIARAESDSDFSSDSVLQGLKTELLRAVGECSWAKREVGDLCRAALIQQRRAVFDEEELQGQIDQMDDFWRKRSGEPEYFRDLWRTIFRSNVA